MFTFGKDCRPLSHDWSISARLWEQNFPDLGQFWFVKVEWVVYFES